HLINDTHHTDIYTLSLHDALPICRRIRSQQGSEGTPGRQRTHRALGKGRRAKARRCHVGRRSPAAELTALRRSGFSLEKKADHRSEEHTSELQSRENLVCRLLLEK